jgi:hypothetical protein
MKITPLLDDIKNGLDLIYKTKDNNTKPILLTNKIYKIIKDSGLIK